LARQVPVLTAQSCEKLLLFWPVNFGQSRKVVLDMGFCQHAVSAVEMTGSPGIATRVVVRMVVWYQCLAGGRPSVCRYVPSCSNYALDALEGHGVVRGSWLTLRRLVRCNPWGANGWDPVPPAAAPPSRDIV